MLGKYGDVKIWKIGNRIQVCIGGAINRNLFELTCMGAPPNSYTIPGFSSFTLAFGWLLLGAVLGFFVTVQMMYILGCFRKEPNLATLAAVMHANATVAAAREQQNGEFLAYIAHGGRRQKPRF